MGSLHICKKTGFEFSFQSGLVLLWSIQRFNRFMMKSVFSWQPFAQTKKEQDVARFEKTEALPVFAETGGNKPPPGSEYY